MHTFLLPFLLRLLSDLFSSTYLDTSRIICIDWPTDKTQHLTLEVLNIRSLFNNEWLQWKNIRCLIFTAALTLCWIWTLWEVLSTKLCCPSFIYELFLMPHSKRVQQAIILSSYLNHNIEQILGPMNKNSNRNSSINWMGL